MCMGAAAGPWPVGIIYFYLPPTKNFNIEVELAPPNNFKASITAANMSAYRAF